MILKEKNQARSKDANPKDKKGGLSGRGSRPSCLMEDWLHATCVVRVLPSGCVSRGTAGKEEENNLSEVQNVRQEA